LGEASSADRQGRAQAAPEAFCDRRRGRRPRPGRCSRLDALASRKHDKRAQFYAFDMLAANGKDLRPLPLSLRKTKLAQLLSRPLNGTFVGKYTNEVISATIYSAPPATWVLKVLSQRASIAPVAPASAPTGSRSRIPAHPAYNRGQRQTALVTPFAHISVAHAATRRGWCG
jgi:hypothetical protein